MKDIIQTSCFELLVDTAISDPQQAFDEFKAIFEHSKLTSSPPLTVELLRDLKTESLKDYDDPTKDDIEVEIFDKKGHCASLQYGNNGYVDCGYRIDTGCNDYDENAYPILMAFEEFGGEPLVCDGGHMDGYDEWKEKYEEEQLPPEQKAYRRVQR